LSAQLWLVAVVDSHLAFVGTYPSSASFLSNFCGLTISSIFVLGTVLYFVITTDDCSENGQKFKN